MSDIDISIIIPAHNTIEYLRKCIDSMIHQSLSNIEIIVVDDASTPPIKQTIFNDYKAYTNLIYLRNESPLRPGGARNRGIDVAHGRYISFCDSDDWVDLDLYEQVVYYMDSTKADIGMVSMMRNDDNSKHCFYKCKYDRLYTLSSEMALKILSGNYTMGIEIVHACINKIYRHDFIKNVNARFEQDIYFQGILYSVYTFLRANKIICIPNVTYHHYLRLNSITQSFDKKHIEDFAKCFLKMKRYFEDIGQLKKYASDYYKICEHYINVLVCELFEYVSDETEKKNYLLDIVQTLSQVVDFDDYFNYITSEKLRQHIQPQIKNTFDILY